MLKKILISVVTLVILLVLVCGFTVNWIKGFIPSAAEMSKVKASQKSDIDYLQHPVLEHRGKILAVVTSIDEMGASGKTTGYELTELARAYWVFQTNGFEVHIASTKGGTPPIVLDDDDMREYDYAFLNNPEAQAKVTHTLLIDDVNPADYEAVYFVGGKGAMFDFPDNPAIKKIVKQLYQNGKVVSAVCHGPAALVNVELDNGEWIAANKSISAFTNEEELFLIPDAESVFPFLLQDKLVEQGANFKAGTTYLEQVVQDGKLLTGQNPWSVWKLAENVVQALGYAPKTRKMTPEENSISLLAVYNKLGYKQAKQHVQNNPVDYQAFLIIMHAIISFMQLEIFQGMELLFLVDFL